MKKTLITFFVLLLLMRSVVCAQITNNLFAGVELGYGLVFAEKGTHSLVDPSAQTYMETFKFRVDYFITYQLALCASIEATPYQNYNMIAVPLSIGVRYDMMSVPRLFFYADAGLPISASTASNNFFTGWLAPYDIEYKSGFTTNMGVGYRITKRSYLALGYHQFWHTLSINPINGTPGDRFSDKRSKHAVLLRAGVVLNKKKYRPINVNKGLTASPEIDVPKSSSAPYRKSFIFELGLDHGLAFYDKGDVYTDNISTKMNTDDISLKIAYYLTPKFALGLKLANPNFYKDEHAVSHVAIYSQYDFYPRFFCYGDFKCFTPGWSDIGNEAIVLNTGAGYKLFSLGKQVLVNVTAGYRFMDYIYRWYTDPINLSGLIREGRKHHSLTLGITLSWLPKTGQRK